MALNHANEAVIVDSYLTLPLAKRVALAREMYGEISHHSSRLRSLLEVFVDRLRAVPTDDDAVSHLAQIAHSLSCDDQHLAQEKRLQACLDAIDVATGTH